jgi:hypothetical protein
MSEFKGTKGKWKLSTIITYGRQMVDLGEFKGSVDVWCHSGDSMTKEEAQANALLISKAPEMLEMLKNIFEDYDYAIDNWQELEQIIKEATEI